MLIDLGLHYLHRNQIDFFYLNEDNHDSWRSRNLLSNIIR